MPQNTSLHKAQMAPHLSEMLHVCALRFKSQRCYRAAGLIKRNTGRVLAARSKTIRLVKASNESRPQMVIRPCALSSIFRSIGENS